MREVNFDGNDIYYDVEWDKGTKLPLMRNSDRWMKEKNLRKNRSTVDESVIAITKKDFLNENFYAENKDFFKYFNWSLIRRYLTKLRDSGVTNMMGAMPYLYLGSERVEHLHKYDFGDDDDMRKSAFDEVVEMADQIKNEMISGTMKVLESEDKEITPRSVERLLLNYGKRAMEVYKRTYGGTIR